MADLTSATPQPGIFALGTNAQAHLELDRTSGTEARALVAAVANLREPRTTMAGVNFVVGFRPELWRELFPDGLPRDLVGFNHDLVGSGGYRMPATQRDLVIWFSGPSADVVFDEARLAIRALASVATVAEETTGWPYRRDRDLTGFVDGTKNPTLPDAPGVAIIPDGQPGAGGSILLLQKWHHEVDRWEALSVAEQEAVIGRTKADDIELDPKAPDSHVARTDQDVFGNIFRRNVAYGNATDHGTLFVGYCATLGPLAKMLDSMAGVTDGVRDAITRYTTAQTGGYYFVPCVEVIRSFAAPTPAD